MTSRDCKHCRNLATQERRNRENNGWVPLCDNIDCYIKEISPESFEVK